MRWIRLVLATAIMAFGLAAEAEDQPSCLGDNHAAQISAMKYEAAALQAELAPLNLRREKIEKLWSILGYNTWLGCASSTEFNACVARNEALVSIEIELALRTDQIAGMERAVDEPFNIWSSRAWRILDQESQHVSRQIYPPALRLNTVLKNLEPLLLEEFECRFDASLADYRAGR